MNTQITETKAIQIAKSMITEGYTFSLMNKHEVEDFIWGYLYEMGLQYEKPIDYVDDLGNDKVAIVYQNN